MFLPKDQEGAVVAFMAVADRVRSQAQEEVDHFQGNLLCRAEVHLHHIQIIVASDQIALPMYITELFIEVV